ncbi:hypothetical protein GCK99_18410 [Klebsiella pneumoniae]|nr:hypothetical protein GCK99_18410 [Klebsiella pneumoniae]
MKAPVSGCFFYFSVSEYKYPWGYLLVTKLLVGYLIYRFAYAYIYDEWNDYHQEIKRRGLLIDF